MWVKSRKHAEREAKNRGLIEVGNESPVKMLEAQDRDTAKISDEAFDKSWAKTEHFLKKELGKS